MSKVRRAVRATLTVATLAAGAIASLAVVIAVFLAVGMLTPGEAYWPGSSAPTTQKALLRAAVSLLAVVILAVARQKLALSGQASES